MKILKIDHIGLAVTGIEKGQTFWSDVLGIACHGSETVAEQGVTTAFFPVGESEVELLEPVSDDSPVAKFLTKRGEGMHHIALQVDDIEAALAELKQKGVRLIDEAPRYGAGGAKIAFIHPGATHGILLELCERNR